MKSLLRNRIVRIFGAGLLLVILGALVAGTVWLANPAEPMAEAQTSLTSDSIVKVQQGEWIVFEPRSGQANTGLILYPGGRVQAEAYGPTARAIAEEGYLVVIVPMPLNLAVLAPEAAQSVISEYELIDNWAVGGHSLGGAMAARFVFTNPQAAQGLVLWASFPAQSDDLSQRDLAVSSIYASNDGLATSQEILDSASRLPSSTEFVAIEGGNHAQFGWYGPQSGDGQANISRPAQQQRIIEATLTLLRRISVESSSLQICRTCNLTRLVEAHSPMQMEQPIDVR